MSKTTLALCGLSIGLFLSANAYHVITVNHNFKIARQELDALHIKLKAHEVQEANRLCSSEQAVKWWTDTKSITEARKKLCGK